MKQNQCFNSRNATSQVYLLTPQQCILFVCLFVCFGGRGALLTALKAASLHNSKFEYSNSIFPCNVFILLFTTIEKNSSRGVDHKDRGHSFCLLLS